MVCGTERKAKYSSKVVTQSPPLFYDNRASDRLMEAVIAIEEEDLEPKEVP
jgi:hypothetical protein